MCVCVCLVFPYSCGYPWRPGKDIRSPGPGITSGHVPPEVGAGNKLSSSARAVQLLTAALSLQHPRCFLQLPIQLWLLEMIKYSLHTIKCVVRVYQVYEPLLWTFLTWGFLSHTHSMNKSICVWASFACTWTFVYTILKCELLCLRSEMQVLVWASCTCSLWLVFQWGVCSLTDGL